MASQLDATTDAVQAPSDNQAASTALISEVNADRNAAKPVDSKPADQTAESKINSTFGSLTIVGDDSKDSTSTKAASDTTATIAGDSVSAGPASPTDATAKVAATDAPADVTAKLSSTDTPADATARVAATDAPADVTAKVTAADATTAATTGSDATTPTSTAGDTGKPKGIGDIPPPPTGPVDTTDVAQMPDDRGQKVDMDALAKIHADPEFKAEKKKLDDDITKHEKGMDQNSPEYLRLETMRDNMSTLERRAAAEHPPLAPEELANTYKSISHLIDAKDGPKAQPKADRLVAAEEAMMHAADPNTIDQGNHNTCNVTTVETRLFTKNPAAAVRVIDEAATTGEYTPPGKDPKDESAKIQIDPKLLARTGSEELKNEAHDQDRSYASEVFQVATVNAFYQTHDTTAKDKDGKEVTYPAGTLEYRQGKPDESAANPNSTGEGLFDKRTNQVITDGGQPVHAPNLDDDQIVQAYNMVADHKDSGFFIANKDNVCGEGKEVTKIGSEAELKAKIEDAQKNGKMPLIVQVDANQEPFYSESGGKDAGTNETSPHVVTITGIDDKGNVMMDNQWGKSSKHEISVHDLYIATMQPKDAIGEIKKECAQNIKDHAADPSKPIDYASQAELLRLRRNFGDLQGSGNDAAFKQELTQVTQNAVKDAADHRSGWLDPKAENELKSMMTKELKPGDQAIADINQSVVANILLNNGHVGDMPDGHIKDLPAGYGDRLMQQNADNLYDAGNQWYYNKDDYAKMDRALSHKTPAEINQMDQDFQAAHGGMTMETYISTKFKNHPEERDKALRLLHQAQNGEKQEAA